MVVGLKGEKPLLVHQMDSNGSNAIKENGVKANENNEVLLGRGDGMFEAGQMTKCKNAACYIFCSKENIEKRGSGFYASIDIHGVEHKVIVTNNHVISCLEEASSAAARFHYEGRLQGADLRLRPDILFHTNQALDYTIVGCDHDTIENQFCIDPLEFEAEEEISVGDDIFIFQHPNGDSKKFSYQKISRVEHPFVFYNADTDIGSSGSAVLRKFKLIAVHSKGSDLLRYNKGTLCSEILYHLQTGLYKQSPIVSIIPESACHLKRKIDRLSDAEMKPDQSDSKKRACDSLLNQSEEPITQEQYDQSKPTERKLEELSKDITTYWKHLGRKLNVPNSRIEEIQKDHYNFDDIVEKALTMLRSWVETPEATVKVLKDALIKQGKDGTAQKHFTV